MDIGYVIQIVLFALLAVAILVILVGAARAIPRPHKVRAMRYSKNGDEWILNYKKSTKKAG